MTEALTPDALVTSDVSGASGQTPASPVAGAVPVTPEDVQSAVYAIADRSRKAARRMSQANRAWKDRALRAIGAALLEQQKQVLEANAKDVAAGKANGTSAALLDRLTLTPARIEGLVAALENLAGLLIPWATWSAARPCPTVCACAR